jgi:DNA-binding NarL/FixJ family response regulator
MNEKSDNVRVVLVDDHALFREGIAEILAAEDDISVVGEAANGAEAVMLAGREKPDVFLLDVEMPGMGVEYTIREVLRASPSSRVLVLTVYDEPRLVRELLTLGASGYLVKNAKRDELLTAIRTLYRDADRVVLSVSRSTADRLEGAAKGALSSRELEVLLLVAKALSNHQIASCLHISEGTVKRHLTNIFAKLGVSSRTDAAKKGLESGLMTYRDLRT